MDGQWPYGSHHGCWDSPKGAKGWIWWSRNDDIVYTSGSQSEGQGPPAGQGMNLTGHEKDRRQSNTYFFYTYFFNVL